MFKTDCVTDPYGIPVSVLTMCLLRTDGVSYPDCTFASVLMVFPLQQKAIDMGLVSVIKEDWDRQKVSLRDSKESAQIFVMESPGLKPHFGATFPRTIA